MSCDWADLLTRDVVLSGLPSRRAGAALHAIEGRTSRLISRSRRAMALEPSAPSLSEQELGFLDGLSHDRDSPHRPSIQDLERYVRGISPQIVVNNRIGKRRPVDGDYGTPEQSLADSPPSAQLQESCMTINNTWGYAAWDTSFKSPTQLVRNLAHLTSNGANFLLNIGPTDTGAVTAGNLCSGSPRFG